MSFIYVITNQINGKQYVGKTTHDSIEKRWKEHVKDSKNRRYEKRPLYSAINKYGAENFTIEQLEACSIDNLEDKEIYWIDKLGTYHNGYNATRGGDGSILYDYQEIANKYLELQNQRRVAKHFNCDTDTVKKACHYCGIKLISAQEISKRNNSQVVYQKDKNTQQIINIFYSISEASRITGVNHGSISKVCRGLGKTAGGFIWECAKE